MTMRPRSIFGAIAAAILITAAPAVANDRDDDDHGEGRARVELTWMSIANWYFDFGDLRVIMDGYFTRVPGPPFFFGGGGGFKNTIDTWPVDVPTVLKVRYALKDQGRLDYLLTGHSHFDHSYDTATWSALTGAPIIGSRTTCLQAQAEGLPIGECHEVLGGEAMGLTSQVTMHVVRWNHSGNNLTNPEQHLPIELHAPPIPGANGGFHAGVAEDFPNGGGGRMFLFVVGHGRNRLSFFVNNSASAVDLTQDIVVDGVNYGAPLENLKKAMANAGLTSVDLWIGTGGLAVAQLVVPVLKPRAYIPNHWDGLFNPFFPGLPFPYRDTSLQTYLTAQGIPLLPQLQYFDKYVLDRAGVTPVANSRIKARLGFSDVQVFPTAALRAAAQVQSTVVPDDCQ